MGGNPQALLDLIADLYAQLTIAQARIAQLEAGAATAKEAE